MYLHPAPCARGYFVGLDSQGAAFQPFFTQASPCGDTELPIPNPAGEFINGAF